MRNAIATCLLVLIFEAAGNCQSTSEIREFELSKVTRGYQEHVRITADSLHVFIENRKDEKASRSYSRVITKDEWTTLLSAAKELNLKDLPALPSPGMKRAADAALHATLTVYTKDGQSYSHGYDDEDPHKALQPLRKAIREISSQKQK